MEKRPTHEGLKQKKEIHQTESTMKIVLFHEKLQPSEIKPVMTIIWRFLIQFKLFTLINVVQNEMYCKF